MCYTDQPVLVCEAHPELLQYIENDVKNIDYIRRRTGKELKLINNPELAIADYRISAGESP
jgi:ribonuclease G